MKKKIYLVIILLTCFLCVAGCGNNNETKKDVEDSTSNYTSSDLKVSSNYNKIDDYLNSIFEELDFSGKMTYVSLNEYDTFVTYPFINSKGNTVFTFYFDKEENFMFLNILYDRDDGESISLAEKIIKTKKFDFSVTDINRINSIIATYSATDDIEIGNYIVSNLSSGNMTIKIKEKSEDKQETNNQENKPNNSSQNNNSNEITVSQRNAVNKAKSYLSHSSFSREGLIEQLEFEKFSHDDSIYGVDHAGADWNQQSLKKANSYLSHSAFSKKGLMEQLEFEGFTSDEINYAINNISVNWNEQASKKAKSYLSHSSFSRDSLIEQLEFEGFTHEEAVYGVNQTGL